MKAKKYRTSRRDNYSTIVFPADVSFADTIFPRNVSFSGAVFKGEVDFRGSIFRGTADFGGTSVLENYRTIFEKKVTFENVTFEREADFSCVRFNGDVNFKSAVFSGDTWFRSTTFEDGAYFDKAVFEKEALFSNPRFLSEAIFDRATFKGRTLFLGTCFDGTTFTPVESQLRTRRAHQIQWSRTLPYFTVSRWISLAVGKGGRKCGILWTKCDASFTSVNIEGYGLLTFRRADLRRALFRNTDLTKPEFVDVRWPQKGHMNCVYDEVSRSRRTEDRAKDWGDFEQLYRALKRNYEDRRDHARAGDFHFREKEMRKRNPSTPLGDKALLWGYWILSAYSERIWPAVLWFVVIVVLGTFCYLQIGLVPKGGGPPLNWGWRLTGDWHGFGEVLIYSARSSLFLRPDDFVLATLGSKVMNLIQSVSSPVVIGLLGLAIRQRLKR